MIFRTCSCLVLLLGMAPRLPAQGFALTSVDLADSAALSRAMPRLAGEVLGPPGKGDRGSALDNWFRLQIVAGRYDDAARSLAALAELVTSADGGGTAHARARNVQYEIYVRAKSLETANGLPFARAFTEAFRTRLAGLDDRTAALVVRSFSANPLPIENELRGAIDRQQDRTEISFRDVVALLRAYQVHTTYRGFAPLSGPLVAEDDRRRYIIQKNIGLSTADGATVCALVVRQRAVERPLPALLEFTIYADSTATLNEARRTASNGYVGVEALTRGKGCSPDVPVPYEHDGADAAAVIDWISRQPWSDGRVGMFGGSYNGFTQWAAAKQRPRALKALMPSVTVAPGIDVPMDGNLFLSFVYPWPLYTTNGRGLDDTTYFDHARWRRLHRDWYVSGRAYRALDQIDGTPNPIFNRWLDHPRYDAYWQAMIPYGKEFARIDLPVLTTTGYYDGGQIGALYYFAEHRKHNRHAEHYLVIGPYDHQRGQRGTVSFLGDALTVLNGYETDAAAQIDLGELRYQWFDHVLRGSPKPALLEDRVNYQVMGANRWRHAPSLAAMGRERLRFYLSAEPAQEGYRLSRRKPPPGDTFIAQTVDLADRSDIDRMVPGGGIVDTAIDASNGVLYVSDPLPQPIEVSGLFAGRLELVINKKDLDFNIQLYQLTPQGEYVQLSYYWARASHVGDRVRRRLLTPGKRERLDFESGRLTSRRFMAGSRLVVVVSVVKQPNAQINYGTGRDVSDETIADAKEPLTIRWVGGFIDLPSRRPE